ncbi:MAG: SRPBCC family protein [Verrucomicrobiota bacterium]
MAYKRTNGYVAGTREESLARGLGWFSIGLGLAGLLAPRRLGRTAGVGEHPGLIRLIGLRELASGVGILTQPNASNWLWSRVAGDLIDLVLLGSTLSSKKSSPGRVAVVGAVVAGVTALDWKCSQSLSGRSGVNLHAIHVTRTITVDRSPEELFRFWRNFENLPRFMTHLKSVEIKTDQRSHWVVKGPAGKNVEWDAEIVNERPNQLIAWRSCEGADVDHGGSVRFEPATGGRGTVIKVELRYSPPAGTMGATIAKLLGESPQKQIAVELGRFKQLMETGEIAQTEGQPAGRMRSTSRKFDDLVRAGV